MLKSVQENSKTPVQMAPHVFQTNLINGLRDISEVKLQTVCVPPIGSYPFHYKKFLIRQVISENGVQIGYINLPYLKHVLQTKAIYEQVKSRIVKDEDNWIMIYSLYPPFLEAACRIRKMFPECKMCLIQTDTVPGRNDADKYMSKRSVRKGNWLVKKTKSCDSFVLLTKHLAKSMEVANRPYTVIECICDGTQKMCSANSASKDRCLYTGTIDGVFNIMNLVKAFEQMPDAELWICGDGDTELEIREVCSKYSNIKYYGFVNQEQVQKFRDQCDFLINPRIPTGTYTLYSFPSKTAEYMMSGKPAIMYKLEGIPDEYDAYLNYLTEISVDGMVKELKQIFDNEYRVYVKKAERARTFMLENKTGKKQAENIIDFLKRAR